MLPPRFAPVRAALALAACAATLGAQIEMGPITTLDAPFGPPTHFLFDIEPVDADGDGSLDLVYSASHVFAQGVWNLVTLKGDGSGGFSALPLVGTSVPAGNLTRVVEDFTGDGVADLLVGDDGNTTLQLHAGTGLGDFDEPVEITAAGALAASLDLDGASFGRDLVWLSPGSGLVAARNTAPGVFTPTASAPVPPTILVPPEVADFDGDGLDDVVYGTFDGVVAAYTQTGGGGLAAQSTFVSGARVSALASGDFDSDGKLDLLTFEDFSRTLRVHLGAGDGSFGPPTEFVVANVSGAAFTTASSPFVADLDGDGVLDLLVTRSFLSPFSIQVESNLLAFRGLCDGRFEDAVTVFPGAIDAVASTTPADLDGDGLLDVPLLVGGQAGVALNAGSFTYTDLGQGLAGTTTPGFAAQGALLDGEPFCWTLADALPGSSAALVVGASALDAPFKGGVLVPQPDLVLPGLPVGPGGSLPVVSTWPPAVGGFDLYVQWWVTDAGGPAGFAASPALRASVP